MKKILSIILASTLLLSFLACGVTGRESSISESSGVKSADEMKELFATDNASNMVVTDGTLEYTSNMSYDELKEFYKNIISEIGAVKNTEVETSIGMDVYAWVGADANGIGLTITIVSSASAVTSAADDAGCFVVVTHGVIPNI